MQLRCTYCQRMFAVGRDEMLSALQALSEENQSYYNAHCPHCRRANRVEKVKLERAFPNWQDTLKEMDKEAKKAEKAASKAK